MSYLQEKRRFIHLGSGKIFIMPTLWRKVSKETEICPQERYNYKQGDSKSSMTKFDKEYLSKVLKDNGYDIKIITPEWLNFASQLVIIEELFKLLRKK